MGLPRVVPFLRGSSILFGEAGYPDFWEMPKTLDSFGVASGGHASEF